MKARHEFQTNNEYLEYITIYMATHFFNGLASSMSNNGMPLNTPECKKIANLAIEMTDFTLKELKIIEKKDGKPN